MPKGPQDIEFPIIPLNHCSTEEHCRALQEARDMPFWWYQDLGALGGNFSVPFEDDLGNWWYQVRSGFAWPVEALQPISARHRELPYRQSYLGYQHVVPDSEPSNCTLVINVIMDLPSYSTVVINDKRRNAIRKGLRACELFAIQSVDERWLDGAVQAWNDLVDRTGWKHHRDAGMLRETWQRLLRQPAATILLAMDKATGKLAGFLITKVYGRTAYVDTIASNTELLSSNPNDVMMYTFIRNAQRIPGIQELHFAIKSDAEHLEKFKTSLGCEPHPYPAFLHTRPGMMTALRLFNPRMYTRLTGRPARAGAGGEAREPAEPQVRPAAKVDRREAALPSTRSKEAEAVEKSWYIAPARPQKTGWAVYSPDLVLAAMQGTMADPQTAKRTRPWLFASAVVWTLLVVCQAILFVLAWTPVISWLFETLARTFTRNPAGFFLRSCYWKARLRRLGTDTIIDQGVEIWGAGNVSIGSNSHIDTNVRLAAGDRRFGQRGSITVGDCVHLGPGVHIAGRGGVTIGDFVGIMANAHLYSATSGLELTSDPGQLISMSHMAPMDRQCIVEAPIWVEDYAFIGMMARIMPGVTIGRGAVVHGNTEIVRDVPPFANFGGVPRGRQIGWRRPRRPSPRLGRPSPRGASRTNETRPESDDSTRHQGHD